MATYATTPKQEFEPSLVVGLVDQAISKAKRETEGIDLAGLSREDLDGYVPYDYLQKQIGETIAALRERARQLKELRGHTHEWGANDYCSICGADGLA